jgi:hypothetical protein
VSAHELGEFAVEDRGVLAGGLESGDEFAADAHSDV